MNRNIFSRNFPTPHPPLVPYEFHSVYAAFFHQVDNTNGSSIDKMVNEFIGIGRKFLEDEKRDRRTLSDANSHYGF